MREVDPATIKLLKGGLPGGREVIDAIKLRTEIGIENPAGDPMVNRVVQAVKGTNFEGRILDVGCYGGWLYGYLGKPEGFTGIDKWHEAIVAAKESFPDADFRECDLFDFEGRYDFAWCSQIVWGDYVQLAKEKLMSLASHGALVLVREDARRLGVLEEGKLIPFRW